jgi:hypothetical protein
MQIAGFVARLGFAEKVGNALRAPTCHGGTMRGRWRFKRFPAKVEDAIWKRRYFSPNLIGRVESRLEAFFTNKHIALGFKTFESFLRKSWFGKS